MWPSELQRILITTGLIVSAVHMTALTWLAIRTVVEGYHHKEDHDELQNSDLET